MSITERRRQALQALVDRRFGGVQARFDTAIGRQSDYVSRLLTGKKALGERLAREIELMLGLEPGELDREIPTHEGRASTAELAESSRFIGSPVPVFSWASVVSSDHKDQKAMEARAAIDYLPRPPGLSERAYALPVQGPAMEPEFSDGAFIMVEPQTSAKHGDFVVAFLDGHKTPVLRQLVIDGDTKFLRATNPDYPERMVALGRGEIAGKVVFQAKRY